MIIAMRIDGLDVLMPSKIAATLHRSSKVTTLAGQQSKLLVAGAGPTTRGETQARPHGGNPQKDTSQVSSQRLLLPNELFPPHIHIPCSAALLCFFPLPPCL